MKINFEDDAVILPNANQGKQSVRLVLHCLINKSNYIDADEYQAQKGEILPRIIEDVIVA